MVYQQEKFSVELISSVACWVVCSTGTLIFNKYAIGVFPMACTLVVFQMLFTVAVLVIFFGSSIHIGSSRDVLRWCMVVPFFSSMLLTSILALGASSMTLVVTFRALSPVTALIIERFYPNPLQVSGYMVGSIFVMLTGVCLYTSALDRSDMTGILWVFLNNVAATGDRLLQRYMLAKDQNPVDISKTGLTLLNNALGVIPVVIVALATQEVFQVPTALAQLDHIGYAWVLASCIVGVGLSYTGIWAQSMITATSFLVLVNANKFLVIGFEATFGTKHLTVVQYIGSSISIVGALLYAWSRNIIEDEQKQKTIDNPPFINNESTDETQPLLEKKV